MRILFLCASLEHGRDGVGDYTARLATELRSRGHGCLCAAIDDCHLERDAGENGFFRGADFFRLSRMKSWFERIEILRKEASEFRPDWVSLQFVPHGFHPKGLPLLLPSRLALIGGGFGWHIMFHELWIEPRGRWSNHIISKLQKFLVGELCRKLRPRVIQTSNPYYGTRLRREGIACEILPLFENIGVYPSFAEHRPEEWTFVFFGSLRPGWDLHPLLERIESARAVSGKTRCRFVSIGRLGAFGESAWMAMQKNAPGSFIFERRGELSSEAVSRELQSADFGIAAAPFHLLGKSGAVAAMRAHGLPVIVSRFQTEYSGPDRSARPALVLLDGSFEKNLCSAEKVPCRETLPEIAGIFLNSLAGAALN